MHTFWFVLLVPAAWLAARRVNVLRSVRIWKLAALTAFGAAIAWAVMGAFELPDLVSGDRFRAGLHNIISATDFPLVQLAAAAFVGSISARFAGPREPVVEAEDANSLDVIEPGLSAQ